MRSKMAFVFAVISICFPIPTILIMLAKEPELIDGIMGGLVIGCLCGSVTGIIAHILNRKTWRTAVTILATIPIIAAVFYLICLLPYLVYLFC